jgi:hypothetical protein
VAVGIGAIGATIVGAVDLPEWLSTTLLVGCGAVALVGLAVLVVGLVRMAGYGVRLQLDDDGFLNATGSRVGIRRGAWRDVRKVQADGQVVSVDLSGGRQSIIRTSAIDVDPRELARELRTRLNRDRGYRPLSD